MPSTSACTGRVRRWPSTTAAVPISTVDRPAAIRNQSGSRTISCRRSRSAWARFSSARRSSATVRRVARPNARARPRPAPAAPPPAATWPASDPAASAAPAPRPAAAADPPAPAPAAAGGETGGAERRRPSRRVGDGRELCDHAAALPGQRPSGQRPAAFPPTLRRGAASTGGDQDEQRAGPGVTDSPRSGRKNRKLSAEVGWCGDCYEPGKNKPRRTVVGIRVPGGDADGQEDPQATIPRRADRQRL